VNKATKIMHHPFANNTFTSFIGYFFELCIDMNEQDITYQDKQSASAEVVL
jgi:hypothetical protein